MIDEILLNEAEAPVIFAEWPIASDQRLGVVTLNTPKALNALTLAMIDAMDAQLRIWAGDACVLGVYLRGAGDRAFCAGGDVRALYQAMQSNHDAGEVVDQYPETFFEHEYRLDHLIHSFPKPVICFGHGICMGGGLGVFAASSHRIVTEDSRVSTPEIAIGLFPDAGATAFLSAMPGALGLFLGLTGVQLNGADTLTLGLGKYLIAHNRRADLEQALAKSRWSGDRVRDDAMLDTLLMEFDHSAREVRPAEQLAGHRAVITSALGEVAGDYGRLLAAMRALASHSAWLGEAVTGLEKGCPVTAGIIVEQLQRAKGMTLADMFRMEMVISAHCTRQRDFAEGVRALLIDRSGAPTWSVASLEALPQETVLACFEAPWDENPLHDLRD